MFFLYHPLSGPAQGESYITSTSSTILSKKLTCTSCTPKQKRSHKPIPNRLGIKWKKNNVYFSVGSLTLCRQTLKITIWSWPVSKLSCYVEIVPEKDMTMLFNQKVKVHFSLGCEKFTLLRLCGLFQNKGLHEVSHLSGS